MLPRLEMAHMSPDVSMMGSAKGFLLTPTTKLGDCWLVSIVHCIIIEKDKFNDDN